jgi:hypothetical protein
MEAPVGIRRFDLVGGHSIEQAAQSRHFFYRQCMLGILGQPISLIHCRYFPLDHHR